ncbi:MAG: YbaB/EbfC family nucleoid-associated protein [Myxococcota bacterium]
MSDARVDLPAMLRQAQELSEKLRRAQEALRHRTVSATVGGGLVEVTVSGALEIVGVRIDPHAVDPRDVALLQDLVRAAANQVLARAKQLAQEEMQRASGLPLPLGGLGGAA